jgi:hypothetical protein
LRRSGVGHVKFRNGFGFVGSVHTVSACRHDSSGGDDQ